MKLNKKGFTLIELLAVIVILGVLMLVAVPAIGNVIQHSKENSMISSAKMYISTAQNLAAEDMGESDTLCYNIQNGDKSPFSEGYLTGKVEYSNGTWTAYVTDGTKHISVTKDSSRDSVFSNANGNSDAANTGECETSNGDIGNATNNGTE